MKQFIGIPYQDKGRSFEGTDCWGLCQLFYRHVLGIEVPSYVTEYDGAEVRESVAAAIRANAGNWCAADELRYGDVLIFRVMGLPLHTGIYLGDGDFLHSMKGTASCIERLWSITWSKRFIKAIRWQKT